jgi:adenine-specific DNA-methyltransferase
VVCRLLSHVSFNRKVNLVYIDPPYSTGSSSESRNRNHAYHDLMEGAEYLGFLRQRLILIRQLSAES